MKKGLGIVGACVVVATMAGCAGRAREEPLPAIPSAKGPAVERYDSPSAPPPPVAAFSAPAPAPQAPFAPAPPVPPPTAREEVRPPSRRPGLGTEWGETVRSEVREERFERASEDPFALASIRYDDREGVNALTRWHGDWSRTSGVSMAGGDVAMSVVGRRGPLDAVSTDGRVYAVGKAGDRYSIVLLNHGDRRFEAVVSVDGLDVMNGQPGTVSNRGYILDPYSRLEIDGFRQSDDRVAAFRFGRVADSYAARTGSAREVGVIGVALFAQRRTDTRVEEAHFRDGADPFPGAR